MTLNIQYQRSIGGGRMVDEDLNPGVHSGVISAVEMDKQKAFDSEELEDCLRIDIDIDGSNASKKLKPSLHPKSNLHKIIKALNPGAVTAGLLDQDETANEVVAGLVNRQCLIQIEEKVSKSGNTYLVVTSILGIARTNGEAKKAASVKKEALEDPGFDNDSIPF